MKIVEINTVQYGSTGTIMMKIAECARREGMEVYTFSKAWKKCEEISEHEYYGSYIENRLHNYIGRLTGLNGCFSWFGTKKLINRIKEIQPDIVHLHNIHDFCLNYPMLFRYLKIADIKVVWTLHDCWAFTGKCSHFSAVKCSKWKTGCSNCPQLNLYPKACVDLSKFMWKKKKEWFSGIKNMTIVTPSKWLAGLVNESFLREYPVKVINNGIDLNIFKPSKNDFKCYYGIENKKVILGVSFVWNPRKGLDDFIKLSQIIDNNYEIVLVGLSKTEIAQLPSNILGMKKTNSPKELAQIYTAADVFVNLSYEDTFPTVNLEARACGTPIVTYDSCGCPESAGPNSYVVAQGNIQELYSTIKVACAEDMKHDEDISLLAQELKYEQYVDLYGGGYSIFVKN